MLVLYIVLLVKIVHRLLTFYGSTVLSCMHVKCPVLLPTVSVFDDFECLQCHKQLSEVSK